MKVLIADKGGLTTAIDLLESEDEVICATSTAVLHHLSISTCLKYPLFEHGTTEPLCGRILKSSDSDLLYHGACVLSNMAEHEKVKELLWRQSVISALTKMAKEDLTNVHIQVARCICFMSSARRDTFEKTLEVETMQTAILLMSSANSQVSKDAVTAIGNKALVTAKSFRKPRPSLPASARGEM